MHKLFKDAQLKNLRLINRTVRSATNEAMADLDGMVTEELINYLYDLALGEVGLIISGHAAVSLQGRAGPRQLMVHDDKCIEGLSKIVSKIHESKSKIVLQIAHAGIFARPQDSKIIPTGPSVPEFEKAPKACAISLKEIDKLVNDFVEAAERAVKSGFDAIQIHAAHTFMLGQFLSPFFNKRDDEYGGSLENRARLLLRTVKETRAKLGQDYPIFVKINAKDYLDGGFKTEDAVKLAVMLEKSGVDSIEVSGGSFLPFAKQSPARKGLIKSKDDELYHKEAARLIKDKISIPLMLVGGVHSLEMAQKALDTKLADYIALCRPLICEPDLIKKWRTGESTKSKCLSDNLCFTPTSKAESLYCLTYASKNK